MLSRYVIAAGNARKVRCGSLWQREDAGVGEETGAVDESRICRSIVLAVVDMPPASCFIARFVVVGCRPR
jgi:hypothetical protein